MKMVLQTSAGRIMPIILVWLFCACIMIVMPGTAVAENPSDVKLTYDLSTKTLNVTIRHKVLDPKIHYINKVTIMTERYVMKTYPTVTITPRNTILQTYNYKYKGQPTLDILTYSYVVDAVPGQKLIVEIECNYFGYAKGFVIVAPPSGVSDLASGVTGEVVPASTSVPVKTMLVAQEIAAASVPVSSQAVAGAKETASVVMPAPVKTSEATGEETFKIMEPKQIKLMVQFDFDKTNVKQQYHDEIGRLADMLRKNSERSIIIEGHTCNMGSERYNITLSYKRAANVRQYLINKFGIDGSRIKVKAYGEGNPVADNSTKEGRQLNRRAEDNN